MIGILSDSHDNLDAVRRAAGLFKDAGCRLVIHAGDFVAPFAARELEKTGCPVRAVFGNCDGEKAGLAAVLAMFGEIREAPFVFETEGIAVLVAHLDSQVRAYAASGRYGLLVYGHTHQPEIRRAGRTLVVNPGEAGGWVTGKKTVALFDPKTAEAEILPL